MSHEPNPYAAPSSIEVESAPDAGVRTLDDYLLLKDFRTLCLALTIVWIVYALYCACMAYWVLSREPREVPPNVVYYDQLEGIFAGVFAFGWGLSSFGTYLRQTWSFYFGLMVTYLAMIPFVPNFDLCIVVLLAPPIALAHLVVHKHRRLTKLGIRTTAWC